jgi:hypothetical protein
VDKYENLKNVFPQMQDVIIDSIQSDILDIKKINFTCEQFESICTKYPSLEKAKYVVFSPYISKRDHNFETFIFVDQEGTQVCHLSGQEMSLYGMLESCVELIVSDEYKFSHKE